MPIENKIKFKYGRRRTTDLSLRRVTNGPNGRGTTVTTARNGRADAASNGRARDDGAVDDGRAADVARDGGPINDATAAHPDANVTTRPDANATTRIVHGPKPADGLKPTHVDGPNAAASVSIKREPAEALL